MKGKTANKGIDPKKSELLRLEQRWFFVCASILLVLSHTTIYFKLCHVPKIFEGASLLLIASLVTPHFISKVKKVGVWDIFFFAYLIYATSVAVTLYRVMTTVSQSCLG